MMNPNRICVIYCPGYAQSPQESIRYVRSLLIPEGYELEVMVITDAASIFEGYNRAMRQSDAKYKVYLDSDTFVINKNFFLDVLDLFYKHEKIGLLGVLGSHKLPINGILRGINKGCGKVYEAISGKVELFHFGDSTREYESVEAVDGLILITQYDIAWRDDLFDGWHMYDLSQSVEFLNSGYEIGIPQQEEPWCIHDQVDVDVSDFARSRVKFLEVYAKELFPLVSVLIPTYNRPDYFEQALLSVLNQTYKNIEIVVCDDSTNDETTLLLQTYLYKYPSIRYYKNEYNLGQFKNDLKCMELARGEFINFLMDDDLFHPEKIEKMMNYFIADNSEEIMLITSHRQVTDMEGNHLEDWFATQRLFNQDTTLDGKLFGEFILEKVANFIGEPTTVLFRNSMLSEPFGTFAGREYSCNVDLATWMNLIVKGKMVYISDTLSYFRIHEGQQGKELEMRTRGRIDYAYMTLNASQIGFFQGREESYIRAIDRAILMLDNTKPLYNGAPIPSIYGNEISMLRNLLVQSRESVHF